MEERLTKNFQCDDKVREFLKQIETAAVFISALACRESQEPETISAVLSLLAEAEGWLNALQESWEAAFVLECIVVAKNQLERDKRVTVRGWWKTHEALLAVASYLKSQTKGESLPEAHP